MTATVIVPTVRGVDRIGLLLDSLRRQTVGHQVLVVDNGSSDGTAKVLARYPDVESIRLDRNAGFSRAVNLAAQRADGDSLVLVNDDCVCDDEFVEHLTEPIRGDVVMSAGVMRDHVDEGLIDSAGMELSSTLLVFDYLHGRPLEALGSAADPIGPSAAAAGIDRDAFLEAGGFDEALFAYWEDVDLVLRLRLAGGRCALCPGALGTHMHSATLGTGSVAKNRLMGFGRGYVLRKWSVMRGPRALRVIAEEGSLCGGQALIDRNAVGLPARVRGIRAGRRSFDYPSDLLRGHRSPGLLEELGRRLSRRRRLKRGREEPPREGLRRHLAPGADREPAASGAFEAAITTRVPNPIRVGHGNVVFLGGWVAGGGGGARGVELLVDGSPSGDQVTTAGGGHRERSFWWTQLRVPPLSDPATITLALRAQGDDPGPNVELGALEAVPARRVPADGGEELAARVAGDAPLAVICMATYEPPADLFVHQVESIRAQTHPSWVCVISDDGSSLGRRRQMREAIGGDPRFLLNEHDQRLGFYANFERALEAVPPEAAFVALADQDDRWHPEKLAALIGAVGDCDLAYTDMRVVDRGGEVISGTYWSRRRNNFTDCASMLVGNTVTGAASLFRADLLDRALPFPPGLSDGYHDHWIALNALAGRGIVYVDRPLLDYVQHGEAAQGHAEANAGARYLQLGLLSGLAWQALRALAGRRGSTAWADRYFGMYLRTVIWARVLLMRNQGSLSRRQRRALDHVSHAERSTAALLWLAGRSVRPLWGANEAFGRELLILSSALWMRMTRLRLRGPD